MPKTFVAHDSSIHGDYRVSNYRGVCRWCETNYYPGDKVNWNPRIKHTCCHNGCYKVYGNPVGDTISKSAPNFIEYVKSHIDSIDLSRLPKTLVDELRLVPKNPTPTPAPIVLDEVDFVPAPKPTTIANKTLGDGATIGETILDNIRQYLDGRLTGLVNEHQVQKAIEKALEGSLFKVVHTVTVNAETEYGYETKDLGVQHKCFVDLLDYLKARDLDGYRLNVLLKGPAGSGKTTGAKNCAKALGLNFYFTGSIDTEYKLLGFTDIHGKTVRTPFREAWEFGGLFLFDEFDGSLAPPVLAMNAALANHACAFPDGIIPQHKDCVIIAAANTWGLGADDKYVGRTQLDKASLDRFIGLEWEYDEELEVALNGGAEWVKRVQTVRNNIKAKGIQVIVSPRASMYGLAMLKVGIPQEKVEKATLAKGMSAQQWESVK